MNVHSEVVVMSPECKDKKMRILNATEKLVAEEGIHGLSMQKLAKEAEVAAGTIYRYFKDKDHLIEETRFHVSKRAADIFQAGLTDEMTLKEKYSTIWLNIWTFANTKDAVRSYMLFEQLSSNGEGCDSEKEIFNKIEQMFNDGKSQGIFKSLDNRVLSSISLESSAALARKQRKHRFQVDEKTINQAINASWDALIIH